MELVLKSKSYGNIVIDNNKIIGIVGRTSSLKISNVSMIGKDYNFYTNLVASEISLYPSNKKEIIFKELNVQEDFLQRKISELSNSEKHLLKYIIGFLLDKDIIVIDEPFIDMDYNWKKKLISLFKRIIYKTDKTILIISNNINIIYELCDNILILEKDYCYGKTVDIFKDKSLLDKYNIDVPDIVEFINLAKSKNVLLDYSFDIRDLIKDVYKSV